MEGYPIHIVTSPVVAPLARYDHHLVASIHRRIIILSGLWNQVLPSSLVALIITCVRDIPATPVAMPCLTPSVLPGCRTVARRQILILLNPHSFSPPWLLTTTLVSCLVGHSYLPSGYSRRTYRAHSKHLRNLRSYQDMDHSHRAEDVGCNMDTPYPRRRSELLLVVQCPSSSIQYQVPCYHSIRPRGRR